MVLVSLSLSLHPNVEDQEDGMVVLQALVEGMVLEVHVTNRQSLETEAATVPLVEVYTQFGSQVPTHHTRGLGTGGTNEFYCSMSWCLLHC